MTNEQRMKNLSVPTGKFDVVLDTDAYNEIDDQFAIAYMLRSPERMNVKAFCAEPFFNSNSTSPEDGMYRSYEELLKLLKLADREDMIPHVYKGSTCYLPDEQTPVPSDAATYMANLANEYSTENPLYIVAIGAIINVASALLMAPDIAEKAVLIWLGGHAQHWKNNKEFNLYQDVPSAQVVFDSKIPFVQIPCNGVCSFFHTTIPELAYYLEGKNPLCDYLMDETRKYNSKNITCWSKVIWDVTAVAALVYPETLDMVQIPRPIITDNSNYAYDMGRPHFLYVRHINRDKLYADLFAKLANVGKK